MPIAVATLVRTETVPRVLAPSLAPVLETLLALHEAPDDPRTRIQARLLTHSGADLCPRCHTAFTVADFSATRTSFVFRRSLTCGGCSTCFVVDEHEQA